MRRPSGLKGADMPLIVRLLKSIHDLSMASPKFREQSDPTLTNMRFIPTIEI